MSRPEWLNQQFWNGFFLWLGLAGIGFGVFGAVAGLCLVPLDIVLLLLFAFGFKGKYRHTALGFLSAYALNFAISLVMGMSFPGSCGIPFFLDTGI